LGSKPEHAGSVSVAYGLCERVGLDQE